MDAGVVTIADNPVYQVLRVAGFWAGKEERFTTEFSIAGRYSCMKPTPFQELKTIMDRAYASGQAGWSREVQALLEKNGIRERQDDGELTYVTFSIATSESETFVVGLRYEKRDGTFTEDTFVFTPDKEIIRCYGKRVERLLPEYKGTHKKRPEGM